MNEKNKLKKSSELSEYGGYFKKIWNAFISSWVTFWIFMIMFGIACGMLGHQIGFDTGFNTARETIITPIGELKPIENFQVDLYAPFDLPDGITIVATLNVMTDYYDLVLYYEYGRLYFNHHVVSLDYFNISLSSNLVIFYENSYVTYLDTTDFDWAFVNETLILYSFYLFERMRI